MGKKTLDDIRNAFDRCRSLRDDDSPTIILMTREAEQKLKQYFQIECPEALAPETITGIPYEVFDNCNDMYLRGLELMERRGERIAVIGNE